MADQNYVSSSSWIRGKAIGRGCFGTVSLAVRKPDGKIFAVKSVDRDTCLPGQLESLENEIRVLRSLSSSASSHFIVGFLGDDVTREGPALFRNLHLDYMPRGTVADVAGDDLGEPLVRRLTWCLVSALRRVHARGFVHCDVKGKNVLLGEDDSGSAKLADFGSAMEVMPRGTECTARISPRGSPLWMAPEVIRREYQGPESDVWSIGCTVIEMVTGIPPWQDSAGDGGGGGAETLREIGFSDELPTFPTRLSELGRDFIEKCLRRDPSERWSCDQLLHHQFISPCNFPVIANSSPRCVLDRIDSAFDEEEEGSESPPESNSNFELSARGRISKLAISGGAIWETVGWFTVRGSNYEEEGTRQEFSVFPRSVYSHPTWPTTRAKWELYENSVRGSQWQNRECVVEPVGAKLGPWLGRGFEPRNVGWSAVAEPVVVSCKLLLYLCWLQRFTYDSRSYNLHLVLTYIREIYPKKEVSNLTEKKKAYQMLNSDMIFV